MAPRHAGHALELDETEMIAGIGCRSGVSVAEVLAAIDAALAQHEASRSGLEALAVLSLKSAETSIRQSAELLGIPLRIVEPEDGLITPTHSDASHRATGQGSASEAAALLAAGSGGRLLGERIAVGPVTCALSQRGET